MCSMSIWQEKMTPGRHHGIVYVCGGNVEVLQKEVKVHSQGHMFKEMATLEGLDIRNIYAKYERPISPSNKVIANVQK